MDNKYARLGIIFGAAGSIIGGLLWIIIAGVAISSPLFIIIPSMLAIIFFALVIIFYNKYPKYWLIILGVLILGLIFTNFIFLNILFKQIPESIWGIDTGRNQYSIMQLNIFLGIFSFWGLFCIILGVFKKKFKR